MFLKNVAKSVMMNVIPQGIEQKLPNLSSAITKTKENFDNSKEIIDQMKTKAGTIRQSFVGLGKIHKSALRQVMSGKFGTSKEDRSAEEMKAAGIDFDMSAFDDMGSSDFGPSSLKSSGDDSSLDSGPSMAGDTNYYNNITGGGGDNSEVVGAVASQTILNQNSLALLGKIMTNMAEGVSLLEVFQREKTSSYYDMSLETMKAIVEKQDKFNEDARPLFAHYKDLEDSKVMKSGDTDDVSNILDPSYHLKKLNDSMLLSDMAIGGVSSKIKEGIKDPIGMAAGLAFGALTSKLFGKQIQSVENFVSNLPETLQAKFEKWSSSRDYADGDFSLNNMLASVGDMLAMDRKKIELKANVDKEGAAEFDTMTRRAIITVIPGYLAKILRELQIGNGMFSTLNKIEQPKGIGFDIYDNAKGRFVSDKETKKKLAEKVKDINTSNFYGGVGNLTSSFISATDTEAQKAEFTKETNDSFIEHMNRIAMSNRRDEFDPTDKDGMLKLIKETYAEELKTSIDKAVKNDPTHQFAVRKQNVGESEEDYSAFKKEIQDRRKAYEEGEVNSKVTAITRRTESYAENAKRAADPEVRKRMLNQTHSQKVNDLEEKLNTGVIGEAEYRRELRSLSKQKKEDELAIDDDNDIIYAKNVKYAMNKAPYEAAEKAKSLSTEASRSGAESTVLALSGGDESLEIKDTKKYKSSAKATVEGLQSDFEKRFSQGAGGIESFFGKISGMVERGTNKILEKSAEAVKYTGEKFSQATNFMRAGIMSLYTKGSWNELKAKADEEGNGFFSVLGKAFNLKLLIPLKKALLGPKAAAMSDEDIGKASWMDSISDAWDRKILNPMKGWLLGGNATEDQIKGTSFFESIGIKFNSILLPAKKWLNGDDEEKAKNTGFFESVSNGLESKVFLPARKWLFGGDEEKAKNNNMLEAISSGLETKVFFPVRKWLFGGDEEKASQNNLFAAISSGFDTKIMQPLKGWLFGEEGKTKGLWANFTETFGPKINKILFGDEKAGKKSLWDNIKGSFSAAGDFISNKVFKPMKNWLFNDLFPGIKDMFSEFGKSISSAFSKVKTWFSKDVFNGAKGIMKDFLGDDAIKKIRDNLVDPFKNAVSKLTESLGGMLRFFMHLPVNFFKGIALTLKSNRMKKGDLKDISEEDKDLINTGKIWDFKRGTAKKKPDVKKVDEAVNTALTAPPDFSNRIKGYNQVGKNIVQGAVDGVNSEAANASNAIVNAIASGPENEVKNALDIHSPSRVYFGIGSNTVQGYIDGIKSRAAEIVSTMKDTFGSHSEVGKIGVSVTGGITPANVEKMSGNTSKTNTILEKMNTFMESNLKQVDVTLINILEKLTIDNGRGGREIKFMENPFGWLGSQFGQILAGPLKMASEMMKGFSGLLKSFAEAPKKILDMVGNTFKGLITNFAKLLPDIGGLVGNLFKVGIEGATKLVDKLANTVVSLTDKAANMLVSFAGKISEIAKPLTDAFVDVSKTLMEGLKPAFKNLSLVLGHVVSGLTDFGKKIFDTLLHAGNRILDFGGGLFNYLRGKNTTMGDVNTPTKVAVVGWNVLGSSASNPMYVHVVDGKVQVYNPNKSKAKVNLTNNIESIIPALSGKGKKEEDKPEDSTLTAGLAAAAGTVAGGAVGKAATALKGGVVALGGRVTNTVEAAKTAAKAGVNAVTGRTTGVLESAKNSTKEGAKQVFERFGSGEKRVNAMRNQLSSIDKIAGRDGQRLATVSQRIAENAKNPVNARRAARLEAIKNALPARAENRLAASENLKSSIAAVESKKPTLLGKVGGFVGKAEGGLNKLVSNSFKGVGGLAEKVGTGKYGVSKLGENVSKLSGMAGDKIKTSFSNAGKFARSAATGAGLGSKALGGLSTASAAIGNAGTRASSLIGNVTGSAVGAAGNVVGKTVSAAGGLLGSAGKAFGSGGAKLVSGFSNLGALKGGIGSIAALGGEALADKYLEKGGSSHKLAKTLFSKAGNALSLSAIPIVGPAIAAAYTAFNAIPAVMGALKDWVEDKFKDEIEGATTAFLEFPDKLGAWIERLPEQVDTLMEDLPKKLMALFDSPTEADLDENGLPREEKPSILWKMVKALGRAGLGLMEAMPKLGVVLASSLGKIIMGGTVALGGFIVKGLYKAGYFVENLIDDGLHTLGNKLGWVGDKLGISESDEERITRQTDRAQRQDASMRELDRQNAESVKTASKFGGKIGAAAGSVITAPLSLAAKAVTAVADATVGSGEDAKNQNRYEQAMAKSGNDEVKAKAYMKSEYKLNDSDLEKTFASGKNLSNTEKTATNNARYESWLNQTHTANSPEARSKYDAKVAAADAKGTKGREKVEGDANGKYTMGQVKEAIGLSAKSNGVDLGLLTRMAIVESGMKYDASNPSGAKGLYQFVDSTAKEMGIKGDDVFNPYINADAGGRYIKANMNALKANNIPINDTTLYLAHQQGAGGFSQIFNAATNGVEVNEKRVKNMSINDPYGEGKYRNPRTFIAAWGKKIGANDGLFPEEARNIASVKVDSRIDAAGSGRGSAASYASSIVTPAKEAPVVAGNAGRGSVSSYASALVTPDNSENTSYDKVEAARLAQYTPKAVEVSANPVVTATASAGSGNAIDALAISGGARSPASLSANESFVEKQDSLDTMIAAKNTSNTGNLDSDLLSELRKQSDILSSIAGNTGSLGDKIGNNINSIFNSVANVSPDNATNKISSQSINVNQNSRPSAADMFGNVKGGNTDLRPSFTAMRIASGGNIGNPAFMAT